MGWSGNATIGFSAAGNFYQNHYLSGTLDAKSIACLNSTISMRSNIIYQLSKNSYISTAYDSSCHVTYY